MAEHDPAKFALSLSAKLATRSRHVCIFLGAGASKACGLPDVQQLEKIVLDALSDSDRKLFASQIDGHSLEEALTRLRRIAALVSGEQVFDSFTADRAQALDKAVCQEIVRALDLKNAQTAAMTNFAAWVARSNYVSPVEIFTVNYDLLVETALEELRVPYFDGFVGTLQARFQTELVEALPGIDREYLPSFFARLWKLHGSVNWQRKENGGIVRLGQPISDGNVAAIYPSDAKYEESRRVPFVVLQDRLRRALHQPETLLILCGYRFTDAHLNELLFDAATRRERSEFVALCYDDIPAHLADRALSVPNIQVASADEAILGGMRAKWTVPGDALPGVWEEGKFALRDFRQLALYLARSAGDLEPGGAKSASPPTSAS